ncbi:MAG: hypothetical protein KA803_07875 [Rhodoferax sp.]|nr:hypothetical protein [Rhodoferax sp.]
MPGILQGIGLQALNRQASRREYDLKINWQFTTKDARIKLQRLYPTLFS